MREQEYCIANGEKNLYGVLYLPDGTVEGKLPLVISSHGFGGSYVRNRDYAERMTGHGFAFYCYDFYGGSDDSRSGGTMKEMSVLTEAGDLEAVFHHLRRQEMVDEDRIFLWGNSQGGYVSTYVAGKYPDQVRGLVLLYPAYVIQDIARDYAAGHDSLPEIVNHWDSKVGKTYIEDALSVNIYALMEKFPRKVLIVHGDQDELVPIRYSREAVKFFPDAELHVLPGSGHGFEGPYRDKMKEYAEKYLLEQRG